MSYAKENSACVGLVKKEISCFNLTVILRISHNMNTARTVVSTVSKSRYIQSQTEFGDDELFSRSKSFVSYSESMKTIFSLREIEKENKKGDQEFEMLMLDG